MQDRPTAQELLATIAELLEGEVLQSLEGEGPLQHQVRVAGNLSRILGRERAWAALVEIVRAKLAITKPGHDAYDFTAELEP